MLQTSLLYSQCNAINYLYKKGRDKTNVQNEKRKKWNGTYKKVSYNSPPCSDRNKLYTVCYISKSLILWKKWPHKIFVFIFSLTWPVSLIHWPCVRNIPGSAARAELRSDSGVLLKIASRCLFVIPLQITSQSLCFYNNCFASAQLLSSISFRCVLQVVKVSTP